MAWYGKGEERIKKFSVYQALEKKYFEVLSELKRLQAESARQEGLIRALAQELSQVPVSDQAASEEPCGASKREESTVVSEASTIDEVLAMEMGSRTERRSTSRPKALDSTRPGHQVNGSGPGLKKTAG